MPKEITSPFKQRLKISPEQLNSISIYTWVKDQKFRFLSCSENLCELAGEESPHGMNGKDDFALIWHKDANLEKKTSKFIKAS